MRGEGNHKIPGSFAPENMEKTGAERVKYSLACQHEDAIPIKFVSYAQKCPTVLCTFAVALRKESVDRNAAPTQEEADRYATDKCDCEIGKACRRQREEREIIAGLFAEFEPDTLRLLEATADMVRKDYIKGGTAIKLAENVTAKFKIKDGTVIVTRSEKHEHQHSL